MALSQARVTRDQYRAMLAQGIDPSDQRKATREARENSFRAIADEWHSRHAPTWAPAHAKRVKERLDNHVMPYIGGKPITEITAPMILPLTMARISFCPLNRLVTITPTMCKATMANMSEAAAS
ncbi:hypothetical protein JCM19379_09300 [Methyloparacoccus murrellii]